jgi:hypothetical protein
MGARLHGIGMRLRVTSLAPSIPNLETWMKSSWQELQCPEDISKDNKELTPKPLAVGLITPPLLVLKGLVTRTDDLDPRSLSTKSKSGDL